MTGPERTKLRGGQKIKGQKDKEGPQFCRVLEVIERLWVLFLLKWRTTKWFQGNDIIRFICVIYLYICVICVHRRRKLLFQSVQATIKNAIEWVAYKQQKQIDHSSGAGNPRSVSAWWVLGRALFWVGDFQLIPLFNARRGKRRLLDIFNKSTDPSLPPKGPTPANIGHQVSPYKFGGTQIFRDYQLERDMRLQQYPDER